jgi:hypothetical protein
MAVFFLCLPEGFSKIPPMLYIQIAQKNTQEPAILGIARIVKGIGYRKLVLISFWRGSIFQKQIWN